MIQSFTTGERELTQFHEGQEVEVRRVTEKNDVIWRKAKIVTRGFGDDIITPRTFEVVFADGSRAVFDADHIRTYVSKAEMEDRFYGGIGL